MADLALGISGRLEEGETLQAWVLGTATGLQWQALVNGAWVNVGAANSQTYVIPAGAAGTAYRLAGSNASGTAYSTTTPAATLDTRKASAPVLAGAAPLTQYLEQVSYTGIFGWIGFSDADRSNYGGGSLLLQNSNSVQHGGDGQDVLWIAFAGTGAGQFSYNAATREIKYAFTAGTATTIGTIDAALHGNGADLKILFNANATQAVVDALIDQLQFTNQDDSPVTARLLTLRVTDPTGASAQRVLDARVVPQPDAPVVTSPAHFALDENQATVGSITATDPDREAGAPQGIAYSLAAGQGDADNALFAIDAATGHLRFKAAPDFEAAHGPQYSVRVRVTDAEGGTAEQVVAVTVRDVNEDPVAADVAVHVGENGTPLRIDPVFSDPDAGDSLTLSIDTTGTLGVALLEGGHFVYSPGGRFESLAAGTSVQDSFGYTVIDSAGHAVSRRVTVTVTGENDAPVVQAPGAGTVVEAGHAGAGTPTAQGGLVAADVDAADTLAWSGTAAGTYGSLSLDAGGQWHYALDNTRAATQALAQGQTVTDSFAVQVRDAAGATVQTQIVITVQGSNDAPVTLGAGSATVSASGTYGSGVSAASGTLLASDPDTGAMLTWVGGAAGTYGTFGLDAAGRWTYALNNASAATQALAAGQAATETFVASVGDGSGLTAQTQVTITVSGANDAPVATGPGAGTVVEAAGASGGSPTAQGQLTATDADGDALAWSLLTGSGRYGTLDIDAAGHWIYTLDNARAATQALQQGQTASDMFDVVVMDPSGDGTTTTVTISVQGTNDAPTAVTGEASATVHESSPSGKLLLAGAQGPDFLLTQDGAGRLLRVHDAGNGSVLQRLLADGTADASFGAMGSVPLAGIGTASVLAMDAAGRIVVAGLGATDGTGGAVVLARYLADGTPDAGFGTGGIATIDLSAGTGSIARVLAMGGGELLLVGSAAGPADGARLAVTKLHADGTVDAGFGNGGTLQLDVPAEFAFNHGVCLDAQGRIVLYGTATNPETFEREVHLLRFGADGSPDLNFGNAGERVFSLGTWYADRAVQLVGTADGGLVLGWNLFNQETWNQPMLTRFDAAGELVTAFGDGGTAATGLSTNYGAAFVLALDAAGKLLLVPEPRWSEAPKDFVLVRFNADGSRDLGFGQAGVVSTDMGGDDQGRVLMLDAAGRITVAGVSSWMGTDVALARYLPDGSLDPAFGDSPDEVVYGQLFAADPEGSALSWSGSANGIYGEFAIDSWGGWSYRIDNSRPATQGLAQGEVVTDQFRVSVTDAAGATAMQDVVITIVGSADVPQV
jgi:uncharacterized delta-60 repeat protein